MTQALQGQTIALVLQQCLDFGFENLRVERLEQVIDRTVGVALDHGVPGLLVGGKENDWSQAGTLAVAHQACHFKTIHPGHLHIQQHQVDFMFE